MKAIVIYTSKTGFTKRYAQWIAQAASAECVELSQAKKMDFSTYDTIVYGGWACAGMISKVKWFKENISKWHDKKLIAFCVGATPMGSPNIEEALKNNFPEADKVKAFYCPGGLNYDKMSGVSKLLMRMLGKLLKNKKDRTPDDEIMMKMIASSYDISDKKYIEPIIQYMGA